MTNNKSQSSTLIEQSSVKGHQRSRYNWSLPQKLPTQAAPAVQHRFQLPFPSSDKHFHLHSLFFWSLLQELQLRRESLSELKQTDLLHQLHPAPSLTLTTTLTPHPHPIPVLRILPLPIKSFWKRTSKMDHVSMWLGAWPHPVQLAVSCLRMEILTRCRFAAVFRVTPDCGHKALSPVFYVRGSFWVEHIGKMKNLLLQKTLQ